MVVFAHPPVLALGVITSTFAVRCQAASSACALLACSELAGPARLLHPGWMAMAASDASPMAGSTDVVRCLMRSGDCGALAAGSPANMSVLPAQACRPPPSPGRWIQIQGGALDQPWLPSAPEMWRRFLNRPRWGRSRLSISASQLWSSLKL